jgi:hypothetical protein
MRISRDEALRLAFSLDVAITALERGDVPTATATAVEEALIHLRAVRSHALRVHREATPAPAAEPEFEETRPRIARPTSTVVYRKRKNHERAGGPASPASDCFEVGFFIPIAQTASGQWISEWECVRTYADEGRAAMAVNYLNGGTTVPQL